MSLRPAAPSDEPFLAEMLRLAAGWREADPPATANELRGYVSGFGREGDHGVIAQRADAPVGAAWCRLLVDGYGFVADDVPELAIAVVPHARGRGIGSALLARLIEDAAAAGIDRLSLSVEPDNPARRLYERHGFAKVGEHGGAWTMLHARRRASS